MAKSFSLQTAWVKIPHPDLEIDAFLAQPEGMPEEINTRPAVIVFQEIFGVNSHIRDVCQRLAREGYLAIAPALYQRIAPGFEAGYSPAEIELGRRYKDQTQGAELLSDTQATIDYLNTLPQVNPEAIASIGFCFGGHVAYRVATLPSIKATASFYGAGIATMSLGGGAPTLSYTPEITGSLYAFFGSLDASIPQTEVAAIATALTESGIPHQIFCYPADHGFFCDQRGSYQREAASAAWDQVKELFRATLT
jgi:carboxymethylenebutenolidase